MSGRLLRLAFAGGGTGGHMVPGLALLDQLSAAPEFEPLESLVWFQSGRGVERQVLQGLEARLGGAQVDRVALAIEPPSGGAPSTARTLTRLLPEALRARRALRRAGSQVLVGLGGFTSAPAGLAARSLGIPLVLLEINAAPGRATRLLAPLAREVWHAHAATCPGGRADGRHRVMGAPVSPRFVRVQAPSRPAREALELAPDGPLLVVLGGSQGAGALNAFVRELAPRLVASGVQVIHQVGPGRLGEGAAPTAGYRPVEYAHEVPRLLAAADLVLCRGGASTLAEVGAVGVPAWVVPYPHHGDRHQERNAAALGAGARVVQEEDLAGQADALLDLLGPGGEAARGAMRSALLDLVPAEAAAQQCARLRALARPA